MHMRMRTMAALAAMGIAVLGASGAAAQDRPFRTMTLEDDRETLCKLPEVPADLAYTNAENDAYEYWREKLELERRLETGECDCGEEVVTWEEVGEFARSWLPEYRTQPVLTSRAIEAEIDALQARVQAECAG